MKLSTKILFFVLLYCFFLFFPVKTEASQIYFVHSDHLGNTAVITNESGEVVQSNYYYPFGSSRSPSTVHSSLPTVHESAITEHQYTSQISDEDQTGLYYYNARYYDPQIAKFTQADVYFDGLNRYSYVANNPVNAIDPTGNMIWPGEAGGETDPLPSYSGDDPYDPASGWTYLFDKKDLVLIDYNLKNYNINVLAVSSYTFAENNNGANPNNILEFTSYWSINNWFKGISMMSDAIYSLPSHSGCLLNPEKCPLINASFSNVYQVVEEMISLYRSGDAPKEMMGQGPYYMSHQNDLKRWGVTLNTMEQLEKWLILNFAYHKSIYPDFEFEVELFAQNYLNPSRGYQQGPPMILVVGNHPCVSFGSCGGDRPGSNRLDKLDEQYQEYLDSLEKPHYGGMGCFTAETAIYYIDGSLVKISDVKKGDKVLSYDTEKGMQAENEVEELSIHENNSEGYLIINAGQLQGITRNHLIWEEGERRWKRAGDLKLGDILLGSDNEFIIVKSIDIIDTVQTVYNLHLVNEPHNFFADGVLVHNMKTY